MKLFKRVLLALFLIVIVGGTISFFHFKNKFLSAPPNELSVSNLGEPIDFIWRSHKLKDKIEPHSSMFVPVRIPGADYTFYMQFDTGAVSTLLYYNQIQSINEKYGTIFKIDTIDGKVRAMNAKLKVGTVDVNATSLGFRGLGKKINWEEDSFVIIGTVGNDFIEKNPVIIDFKNQQITLTNSEDPKIKTANDYLPFTFDARKIFLSAKLNNKPVSLWYDSGSSMFEMIVEESAFWDLAAPGAAKESFEIPSWKTKVPTHSIKSSGEFQFGSVKVPLTSVTYMEWPNKVQAFVLKLANIGGDLGGMTGNKLFLEKTLILDTPNLRYAVKE